MSTAFLPGADDELRERVAVEIARLRVQRALQDTLRTTGRTTKKRTNAVTCVLKPSEVSYSGAAPRGNSRRKLTAPKWQ